MGLRHLSEVELIEYADGETSPSRRERVEEHVRQCARCAAGVAELRDAMSVVGALDAVAVPADLRERVRARIEAPSAAEITCRKAAPLAHQHLDGCLSPADEAVLHHHLSACGRCRLELAALAAAKRLVESLPGVESPPLVREAVGAARRARGPEMAWTGRWGVAVAVASVVVIGVLGLVLTTRQPAEVPEGIRVAEEVVRPGAQPVVVAERSDSIEADAVVGEVEEAAETAVVEAPMVPRPEAEARRGAEPRAVAHLVRGPTPAPTTIEPRQPEVPLPSALRTLRAVARSASHDREVRLAMELAGEQFATLDSERMWARLHSGLDLGDGDEAEAVNEGPALGEPVEEESEEPGEPARNSAWAPEDDAAGLSSAPLV